MLGDAATSGERRALKKTVEVGVRFHANMLVLYPTWRNAGDRASLVAGRPADKNPMKALP